jgi:WD40 repeat protein
MYQDYKVGIWSVERGQNAVVLTGHTGPVTSISFAPDGTKVVTASWDGTARVWPADGTGESVTLVHEDWVTSAEFSPDGSKVLTVSRDAKARIWSVRGDAEPLTLQGADSGVSTAAYAPDVGRVLAVLKNGDVRLWEAGSEHQSAALPGYKARIVTAGFALSGRQVVTGSLDGSVRLWSAIPADEYMNRLWLATSYCLSEEERSSRLGETPEEATANLASCKANVAEYRKHGAYR